MQQTVTAILVLLITLVFGVACEATSLVVNDNAIQDLALRKTLTTYYRLESQDDWMSAYNFRTPDFRETVTEEFYIKNMVNDNKQWKLEGVEILNFEEIGEAEATITITFTESYREESGSSIDAPNNRKTMQVTTEKTVWLKIENKWLCKNPGVRGHLPLNNAF